MINQKTKNSKDLFFEEALKFVHSDIRLTLILLIASFFFVLFVNFILKTFISFFVFIILFAWVLFYLSNLYFVRKKENRKQLANFHFKNTILDILFLTVVIHFFGGVESIAVIFYIAILAWTSNVLLKKQSLFLAFFAIFFYSLLAFLEYFQILPHRELFGPSPGHYQNLNYIIAQIFIVAIVIFFIAENYGNFSENFKKKQEKLIESQREIEEAKDILEIKVAARTKELEDLTEGLEGQVKERTKEIEEKMKELEKFQKLAVGRELKMIELKEEIKRLRS